MNVYGLCQICEKRIEVVNLKAHIRTCMESNARLKVAHGINHNSSNRNSNRSKEQGNAANCAKNILSIGDNLYHSSRKREASLDPQNSKKKFQSVQYLSTIERTEKAGSIGNQAYTNAICNETVGQQRRPSGHSKTSLQTIPWNSYLSMSGFLESDTTHSMTNAGNNTTGNYNTIASGENNFESDEEEQHADFASSEFEAGDIAATGSSSTNRVDNAAQPLTINNCTNLDYSQLVKIDPHVQGKLIYLRSNAPSDEDLVYSPREICWLKLASILEPMKVPKYLYKQIKVWFEETKMQNDIPFGYPELIRQMARKHGLECTRPRHGYIDLDSGNVVKVTTFDFLAQVYSLLSDGTLMREDNLVFGHDPFKKFERKDYLGDVQTSEWYIRTQTEECEGPNDVLVPLIFFIDATHAKGNKIEPISFTLGIFRRMIRITPEAWRHIGFIPGKVGKMIPLVDYSNKDLALHRMRDYHCIVRSILKDLIAVQNSTGIAWAFGDKKANLVFRTMIITGDMEGHAKLTCRLGGHNNNKSNHFCNIKRIDASDPYHACSYVNTADIWRLQEQSVEQGLTKIERRRREKELMELAYYRVPQNGFKGMKFGANKQGLFSACTVCLLHTFKQRFPNDVCDIFLRMFGSSEGTVGRLMVEKTMPKLLARCKRQSDRDYPKLNKFQLRVTGDCKYDASEKYARIFALFLYSLTTCAERVMDEHGTKEDYKPYLCLLDLTLTIYRYTAQEEFPRVQTTGFSEHLEEKAVGVQPIQEFLTIYKSLRNSKINDAGEAVDECLFPKFHYLIHIIDQIRLFGSSMNFDGGASESNFKVNTKNPAMNSQGREGTFDAQTAKNCSDETILRIALQKSSVRDYKSQNINHTNESCDSEEDSDDGDESSDDEENYNISNSDEATINERSARFNIDCDGRYLLNSWYKDHVKPRRSFQDDILQFVRLQLFGPEGVVGTHVPGFTCLNKCGTIFRAHPSYRSGEEWFDYAEVKWEDDPEFDGSRRAPPPNTPGEARAYVPLDNSYAAPAKIRMFLDLRQSVFKPQSDLEQRIYMVIHSAETHLVTKQPLQEAINRWSVVGSPKIAKFWTMESGYRLRPVSSITAPLFIVEDFMDYEMVTRTKFVMEIKKYREWGSVHNV